MADLALNTKQYITLMRAMSLAITLDDHIARIRGDKADAELVELANSIMDKADDFGMSYPEDKPEGEHWTDEMFNDADDGLHALVEDEFWHILAERLAQAEHTKTCTKAEGEQKASHGSRRGKGTRHVNFSPKHKLADRNSANASHYHDFKGE